MFLICILMHIYKPATYLNEEKHIQMLLSCFKLFLIKHLFMLMVLFFKEKKRKKKEKKGERKVLRKEKGKERMITTAIV